MTNTPGLDVSSDGLTGLADDLGAMRDHLDKQVRRMASVLDNVRKDWASDAGSGFGARQQRVAEDVVRLRGKLRVIEEAVRLSANGFTEQELDTLARMRREDSAVTEAEVRAAAEALTAPATSTPHSRVLDV
ncbi:WXG100 family type VII secretion target [Streptomyces montanisoli]|uniref:WXG100 family type VII secretion target n=1 Tax=Streptomyces montanisoli TaxID=2798581 RepID=A0A940MHE9_9ACTN|nr:WXG100 family type VII secretion target [Streptomyces montanisoli]MBP0461147.1 WXG100 family type VII secretion target [Streptomyces montanisoli]